MHLGHERGDLRMRPAPVEAAVAVELAMEGQRGQAVALPVRSALAPAVVSRPVVVVMPPVVVVVRHGLAGVGQHGLHDVQDDGVVEHPGLELIEAELLVVVEVALPERLLHEIVVGEGVHLVEEEAGLLLEGGGVARRVLHRARPVRHLQALAGTHVLRRVLVHELHGQRVEQAPQLLSRHGAGGVRVEHLKHEAQLLLPGAPVEARDALDEVLEVDGVLLLGVKGVEEALPEQAGQGEELQERVLVDEVSVAAAGQVLEALLEHVELQGVEAVRHLLALIVQVAVVVAHRVSPPRGAAELLFSKRRVVHHATAEADAARLLRRRSCPCSWRPALARRTKKLNDKRTRAARYRAEVRRLLSARAIPGRRSQQSEASGKAGGQAVRVALHAGSLC
mmetsp:Transcript_11430/g.42682  ORF Transcript_11430/g.42682 Transcript_11430/m.42682 type:complete len:394 (+) Transcript_11430:1670-2851(+)